MKVIITNTFKKDFYNIFNYSKLMIFFIEKIKKTKLINLNTEYKKFKIEILNQSIRWIIYIENQDKYFIPIFIVKKSDKKYWMNLMLTKDVLAILDVKLQKATIDLNFKRYKVY